MKNSLQLFDLTGKIALVTGGSRGLGKAMALGLGQAGAKLVIADVLDTKETVRELQSLGIDAIGLKLDVTKEAIMKKVINKCLKTFGKIDILINNAGIYFDTPALAMKEKDWDKIMNINVKGSLRMAQLVGAEMVKQKSGSIINIASVAGIAAFAQSIAYNTSKAAILMMTKTLGVEWAASNVRVNAICPGVFATDMTKGLLEDKSFKQMIKSRVPMQRYATPNELMGAALFLASDASSYMTGQQIIIDGGWTSGL